jgi:hypothetical protein
MKIIRDDNKDWMSYRHVLAGSVFEVKGQPGYFLKLANDSCVNLTDYSVDDSILGLQSCHVFYDSFLTVADRKYDIIDDGENSWA